MIFSDGIIKTQFMNRHFSHIGKASETSFLASDVTVVLTKNDSGTMEELQQTHYYPFGGIIADLSTGRDVQNRTYNAKEQDFANNLFWLDYGARQYDPTRGQFTTPDPLAEKFFSTNHFTYCMNNPVKFIDPDGRAMGDYITGQGKFIASDGINDGKLYVLKTSQKRFDSSGNSPVCGISAKEAKRIIRQKDISNKENFVEITGSQEMRRAVVDKIGDNGQGGNDDRNNREYGIMFENGETNPDMMVVKAGEVSDPSKEESASVSMGTYDNATYIHTHPSGTNQGFSFQQAPSNFVNGIPGDIPNSTNAISYVIGMGNKIVYMYNNCGIQATLPLEIYTNYKVGQR